MNFFINLTLELSGQQEIIKLHSRFTEVRFVVQWLRQTTHVPEDMGSSPEYSHTSITGRMFIGTTKSSFQLTDSFDIRTFCPVN